METTISEKMPSAGQFGDESGQIIDHKSINPHYITGLCDGQASFTYTNNGNSVNLRFGIKLSEADKNIIFTLRGFFGAGNVYYIPKKTMKGNGGGTWYYCVTRISEIANIIAHFDKYPLLSRKKAIYSIWKEMCAAKQHPRRPDIKALKSLAEQISALNTKSRREVPTAFGGETE